MLCYAPVVSSPSHGAHRFALPAAAIIAPCQAGFAEPRGGRQRVPQQRLPSPVELGALILGRDLGHSNRG